MSTQLGLLLDRVVVTLAPVQARQATTTRCAAEKEGAASGIEWLLVARPDLKLAHVGSPETAAKRLEQQHQLLGMDIFCGRHRFGEIPDALVEKSIRLFGEKVIPALA